MPNVDINGTVVAFPDDLSQEDLNAAVSKASAQMGANKSSLQQAPPTSTPMEIVEKLAPSNVLKLTGVMGANAPKAANFLLSGMPGLGNPNNIVPDALNLRQGIKQIPAALRRTAQVAGGAPMTPQETLPARLGQAAGTGIEMVAPNLSTEGVKATGPFTAGVKKPATALPGSFNKAGEELSQVKRGVGATIDNQQIDELMTKMERPNGIARLITEARRWVQGGMNEDKSIPTLLAYKQVLGEAQAKGGGLADIYAQGSSAISQKIAEKAPKLADALEKMHLEYVARGNPKASFPWFTAALSHPVGLAKAATLPVVRNVTGAAVGQGIQLLPKAAPLANQAYQYLMDRAKNGRE